MLILNRVVKFFMVVPILKEFFLILRGYCLKSDDELTFYLIYKRLFVKLFKCCVASIFLVAFAFFFGFSINITKIIDLNMSLFSSLLGFGIGVYALIFTVSPDFFFYIKKRKKIAPNAVNADMAYPLAALGMIVLLNFLLMIFGNNNAGMFLSVSSFFYGMAMTFELIAMIYVIASKSIDGRGDKKLRRYLHRR